MPLPESSLSIVCQAFLNALANGIQAPSHSIKTFMGAPADVANKNDDIRLNLFFYRFEPSSFQANAHPNDPWRIRIFCLISCMAPPGDDQGLEEMRLLGMVMSYLHEHRILPNLTIGTETLRLQAVFLPASDEQINQIWSTQGDTTYRPSVIYELALAPVMPITQRGEPPRVGITGLETLAANRRFDPFAGSFRSPEVSGLAVNASNPAWTPIICWVASGECQSVLTVDVDTTDPTSVTPLLWIAGEVGASVALEWQLWQQEKWSVIAGPNLVISSAALVPEDIPVALPNVTLPTLVTAGQSHWQLLLYATRSYQPYAGAPALSLRSNPLLISLFRSSTP